MKRTFIILFINIVFYSPAVCQSKPAMLGLNGTIEYINYYNVTSGIFDKYLNTSFKGVFGLDYDPNINPIDTDLYEFPYSFRFNYKDFYLESSYYPRYGVEIGSVSIENGDSIDKLNFSDTSAHMSLPFFPYGNPDAIGIQFTSSSGNAFSDSISPTGLPIDVNWSMFDSGNFIIGLYWVFDQTTEEYGEVYFGGSFKSVRPVPKPDIDNDCDVDGLDLALMIKAYGKNSNSIDYDPLCDLVFDGVISSEDFISWVPYFGKTDCSNLNFTKTIFIESFLHESEVWTQEGGEYLEVSSGQLHMRDDNNSDYCRYIHAGDDAELDIDFPDIYTWSGRIKFGLDGAVERVVGGDTHVGTFIYNGKGMVQIAFSKSDGVCLQNGVEWFCVPGSSTFVEEGTWHTWYMVVDSSNDPTWSIDIYRDNDLVASGLNAYFRNNSNNGRFGIENRGLATDVAETYWDWWRIEEGANPPKQ